MHPIYLLACIKRKRIVSGYFFSRCTNFFSDYFFFSFFFSKENISPFGCIKYFFSIRLMVLVSVARFFHRCENSSHHRTWNSAQEKKHPQLKCERKKKKQTTLCIIYCLNKNAEHATQHHGRKCNSLRSPKHLTLTFARVSVCAAHRIYTYA